MKIRSKLLIGLILLLSVLGVGIVLTVKLLILPEIETLEKNNRLVDLKRVEQGLNQELNRLSASAKDWAIWDDTYAYVQAPSSDYEQSNLVGSTLDGLNADVLLIVNRSGRVVARLYSERLDSLIRLPLIHADRWSLDHTLRTLPKYETGVLETTHGPLLIASSPIMDSEESQLPQGTLFFGRLVDKAYIQSLSEQLQLPVELSFAAGDKTHKHVSFSSDDESYAYATVALLNNPQGKLRITLRQPRPFFQQALNSLHYAVITILLIGLLVSLVAYALIKSTLVTPILNLQRQAESFGKNKKLSNLKPVITDDELGQLSASFVRMARSIDNNREALELERNRFMDDSLTDALTNLKNRRYLEQYLSDVSVWQPDNEWLLLALDIDYFKQVNDVYGHHIGDIVLSQLAALFQELSRHDDVVVRHGGEEFAIICKQANEEIGCTIAERIRQAVEQHVFGTEDDPVKLTCSIGFFTLDSAKSKQPSLEWFSMLNVADLALYAAKRSGRNSWVGLKYISPSPEICYPEGASQIIHCISSHKLKPFSSLGSAGQVVWQ
ncbi:MAG: diguanylate cyclase [Pontibacterium sp.]